MMDSAQCSISGHVWSRAAAAMLLLGSLPGCVTESSHRSSENPAQDVTIHSNPPANASTLHAMAKILATQGRDQECEAVLKQAIQRQAGYLPAYSDLAELYARHNRVDDAMQILGAGLARSPANAILLNNLGMCQLLKDNYAAALDSFTKAVDAAPDIPAFRANKALALGLLGRSDEAAAIYQQVLDSPVDVRHNLMLLQNAQSRMSRNAAAPHSTSRPAVALPAARPRAR